MELLFTIFIAIILTGVGISIFTKAILSLKQDNIQMSSFIAYIGAVLSIISKEWLYKYTIKHSNILKSPALKANAYRSNIMSSLPVAIVIVTATFFPKLMWFDVIDVVLVSIFIIYPASKLFKKPILNVLDESVDQ